MENEQVYAGFWRISFGNVLTILIMLGALLTFFLTYDHQLRDNTSGLAAQIKASDAAFIVVNNRLAALEEARSKLNVIDEKLNWIKEWMQEQKELARQQQPITKR